MAERREIHPDKKTRPCKIGHRLHLRNRKPFRCHRDHLGSKTQTRDKPGKGNVKTPDSDDSRFFHKDSTDLKEDLK